MRQFFRQRHGDRLDRAQIFCHIFTDPTIPPRSPADKDAVAVFQSNRKTIDFRFHTIGHLMETFRHPCAEFVYFFRRKHILQAFQGHFVFYAFKGSQNPSAHPLCWRVWRNFLRMFFLKIFQTAQHTIVFKIRNGWGIQHIIAVTVRVERITQLFHLFTIIHMISLLIGSSHIPAHHPRNPS